MGDSFEGRLACKFGEHWYPGFPYGPSTYNHSQRVTARFATEVGMNER
jgi:hypothetical protein